jgi:hypothetical protein
MSQTVKETFRSPLAPRWKPIQVGGGQLIVTEAGLRLLLPGAQHTHYANAQLDDYAGLPRRQFPWRPPLQLTVRARSSGQLAGTAGFGFWNHPFAPTLDAVPALPAAIWFFYASPPSDMPLALDGPGRGWKVACLDLTRLAALAWAPLAPPVVLLNQVPTLYRRIWPRVARSLRISETAFAGVGEVWRTYTLQWQPDYARFAVDGVTIMETERPPHGPLGFVAWVDSQWAIVTPHGRLGWGLLDVATPQWLDLAHIRIEPGRNSPYMNDRESRL